jgi:hypothetical protein
MDEMIGYCGYRCDQCAARSDDPEVRQQLVDGWRKIFGHDMYTVDNVCCDGCRGNGRLADKQCQARPCAAERGVDSCAQCDDFACDKVRFLFGSRETMLIYGHKKLSDLTEEEYNLCMRQFDALPNLVRQLVRAGKLPDWIQE